MENRHCLIDGIVIATLFPNVKKGKGGKEHNETKTNLNRITLGFSFVSLSGSPEFNQAIKDAEGNLLLERIIAQAFTTV